MCFIQSVKKKNKKQEETNETERLLQEIDKARLEWDIANQHFQDAYHPEMVEYMIYYINAAEKKYMYLLKEYKKRYKVYQTTKSS